MLNFDENASLLYSEATIQGRHRQWRTESFDQRHLNLSLVARTIPIVLYQRNHDEVSDKQ
jgi:hypothetical protein